MNIEIRIIHSSNNWQKGQILLLFWKTKKPHETSSYLYSTPHSASNSAMCAQGKRAGWAVKSCSSRPGFVPAWLWRLSELSSTRFPVYQMAWAEEPKALLLPGSGLLKTSCLQCDPGPRNTDSSLLLRCPLTLSWGSLSMCLIHDNPSSPAPV